MTEKIVEIFKDFISDLKIIFPDFADIAQLELLEIKLNSQTKGARIDFVDNISSVIMKHHEIITKKDISKIPKLQLFSDNPLVCDIIADFLKRLSEPDFLSEDQQETIWQYMSMMLDMVKRYKKSK